MIPPLNIFVIGGGGFMIPYGYKTNKLMVMLHSTWVDTGDDDDDDDDDEEEEGRKMAVNCKML